MPILSLLGPIGFISGGLIFYPELSLPPAMPFLRFLNVRWYEFLIVVFKKLDKQNKRAAALLRRLGLADVLKLSD